MTDEERKVRAIEMALNGSSFVHIWEWHHEERGLDPYALMTGISLLHHYFGVRLKIAHDMLRYSELCGGEVPVEVLENDFKRIVLMLRDKVP